MAWILKFAWRRRRAALAVAGSGLTWLAAFQRAINLDEGSRRHIKKQLSEVRRLPGRLMT